MKNQKTLFNLLSVCQVILFASVLMVSFSVPIYTDEIAWKWITARYFLDGNSLIYIFPQCKSAFFTQPPFWSFPFYWAQHFLYADLTHLFKLRVLGVFSFILWGWLLWRLTIQLPNFKILSSWKVLLWMTCYFGCGVLPFAMVLNRPEQFLLFSLTLAVFLPFLIKRDSEKERYPLGFILGHSVLWIMAFAIHPKASLFIPVWVASLCLTVKSKIGRVLSLVILSLIVVQTHQFWKARTSCQHVPKLEKILDEHMLKPQTFFSNPSHFLITGLGNLKNIRDQFRHIDFNEHHSQAWLPSSLEKSGLLKELKKAGPRWFAGVVLILVGWNLVFIRRALRSNHHRQVIMIGALFLSLIGWNFLQTVKNFYEISLFFPLLGFLFILCLIRLDLEKLKRFVWVGNVILAFALLSEVTLLRHYLPQAVGPWIQGGYLEKQPVSVSAFYLEQKKSKIIETAKQCGIPEHPSYLVVDDLTYSVFSQSFRPLNILNLSWGVKLDSLSQLLFEYQSDGIVIQCNVFPVELKSQMKKVGEFCCVGPFKSQAITDLYPRFQFKVN